MIRIPVVEATHERMARIVGEGDLVVDATAGTGGDTEFLCGAVGRTGRVISIDIQQEAIELTRSRLIKKGLADRCLLLRADHATLSSIVNENGAGKKPRAVMFNLGYLPGADTDVATRPATSVAALQSAVSIVDTPGIVSIAIYRGHAGALDEAAAVEEWLAGLRRPDLEVAWLGRDGVPGHRPYAVFITSISNVLPPEARRH